MWHLFRNYRYTLPPLHSSSPQSLQGARKGGGCYVRDASCACVYQNPRQSYNFFLTFHSQIVQIYSQIVQIYRISSQLVPIRPNWSKKVKKKQKTVATNVTTEIGGLV